MIRESDWKIVYREFNAEEEPLREAICTLGNGYIGTRGAFPEVTASNIHYPGTYIAGVYNRLKTHIASKTVVNEDLVNCPNWLFLTFRIRRDDWFSPSRSRILYFRQELDMKRGVLHRDIRASNRKGYVTRIETRRIVHINNPHLLALQYTITPQNYSDVITVRHLLDGSVINSGVERYRQLNSCHLDLMALGSFSRNGVYLSVVTNQSRIEISQAAKLRVFAGRKEISPVFKLVTKNKLAIGQEFRLKVKKGTSYRIEKIVSVYTSRDERIVDPIMEAVSSLKRSPRFSTLFSTHVKGWRRLWKIFDISIKKDSFSQKVLRLHTFHLLQVFSLNNVNIDAGFPARGLHGESYRGHIFWDELFALPFYNHHLPAVAKAMLLYRYRRLNKAREYAESNGYKGAMFPWQSASTGEEETQVIHLNPLSGKWDPDYSRLQRHVSFAIAYNVWSYFKNTEDYDFMSKYGAEMFFSIAQFAASLVRYNKKDKKFHTYGIMGPDEFHEKYPASKRAGLKDNAYSNFMISWVLTKALELVDNFPKEEKSRILKKLNISGEDLRTWDVISRNMNIIINERGIISQFDGYFRLKELDWDVYRTMYGNIQRMDRILKAEGLSPDDYKVTKQADVLMMFYLFSLGEIKKIFERLGYVFDKKMLKNNYLYYLRRTSHGSTLSKVVHCLIALYLRRNKEAWEFFRDVLESDIYDIQGGTTPEGIHTGVMAGSLDIVIRGFGGVNIVDNVVYIKPRLPSGWKSIKFKLLIRNRWFDFNITRKKIVVVLKGSLKGDNLYIASEKKKINIKGKRQVVLAY